MNLDVYVHSLKGKIISDIHAYLPQEIGHCAADDVLKGLEKIVSARLDEFAKRNNVKLAVRSLSESQSNERIDTDNLYGKASNSVVTRVKNFLTGYHSIETYGQLLKAVGSGELERMSFLGKTSTDLILKHLLDKGYIEYLSSNSSSERVKPS